MPDQADPAGVVARARGRFEASYPGAVVRRFFGLELLDRSFALAAQAFVALLPLVIVVVSAFVTDSAEAIANSIGDRFGLDVAARAALRVLFEHPGTAAISWLAILISLLSAFSLSRRLARTYAVIFEVAPLPRSKSWHGLVWIVLQITLFVGASMLRDLRVAGGPLLAVVAVIGILLLWFAADVAGLRLLVPSAPVRLVMASSVLSSLGRVLIAAWAAIYMPASLSQQAAQYGPIGVTFSIFTYIFVGVLAYLIAPLLVTTWVTWRADRGARASAAQ
jgi:membrane protein